MTLKNKKHELFCNEYIIDLNGAQAAIRAGYSEKTSRVTAAKLLTKANIQSRISELQAIRSKRTEITQDMVLKELAHIAFDDIKNYLSFRTDKNSQIVLKIKDSETIDTRNISEISLGKDGQFKFKLYCKDNALVQLGKHLGMFKGDIISDGGEEINKNLVALAQILQKPQQPHVIESDSSE